MKTLKNKIVAVTMILAGCIPVWLDNDATVLVMFGCIAVPLFFAKKQWVY